MRNMKSRHIETGARNSKLLKILLLCIGACLIFCAAMPT